MTKSKHQHRSVLQPQVMRRVFREARAFRWHIVLIFGLSIIATPLTLLGPIPLKIAVDSVLGTEPLPGFIDVIVPDVLHATDFRLLVIAAVMQVLVVVLLQLQANGTFYFQTWTGERLALGFRARLLDHAQRLSFAYHDARGTSDSIYRIQWDAPAIQWIPVYSVIPLITSAFTLVAMIVVMFVINWQLALVALAIAPPLFYSVHSFSLRMRGKYHRAKELESSALKVIQEVLTSFRVVKAFGREDDERDRFVEHSAEGMRARLRLSLIEGAFAVFTSFVTALGTAVVLFVGFRSVQEGDLSLGELLMVLAYLAQLYGPLQSISKQTLGLQNHLASAQRAFDLLDQAPQVVEKPGAVGIEKAVGDLRVENLWFSYDGVVPVLKDITVAIPAGSRIGVAGRTGAGKTTLISLLTRFYDPTSGRILLDGVDLKDLRLEDLRRQFSIVLQEPVLFSTTIAENIAYAKPGASMEEVMVAARAAEAHDFIERLPAGYETLVGERGMSLSGGQRQRLSLARAFLKDAPVLILDEPTSSVDTETEKAIMTTMERLMHGRTTLMIAHRMSTLDGCDAVLRIEGGRLASIDLRSSTLESPRSTSL